MTILRPRLGMTLAALLLAGGAAHAATIATTQITPSTTLGQYLYFSIDQMTNGNSSESPLNGYASGFGVTSGRITLTLDQAYDLDSFVLWNDINILNEGVRSFKLVFEDASGSVLGSTGTLNAISMFAPQTYTFANVSGVKTVQMDVLTSSLQIEIREVAFNGVVTAVPEPSNVAMMLAGLVGLGGVLRARRR
jgi:hypothetical protein